jgi:DNA-binding beta-propeller fold protein YncE
MYQSQVVASGSNGGGFASPKGMAVDGTGNIWVADSGNNRVLKFSSGGTYLLQIGGGVGNGNGQFNNPWGIAADASGNVWVTDTSNNRVQEFNSSGVFLRQLPCASGACGSGNAPGVFAANSAIGIALDTVGNVWVVDAGNCRVEEFSASGAYLSQFATGCNQSMLAIDGGNNFWIADPGGQRVVKYNTSGTALLQVGCSSGSCGFGGIFNNPSDVAVDSSGNVWVTDTGHARVVEFSNSGALLSQFPCSSGVCSTGGNTGQFAPNSAWGIAIH